jgi:hypothetical protein
MEKNEELKKSLSATLMAGGWHFGVMNGTGRTYDLKPGEPTPEELRARREAEHGNR